jgi:hypothetical protein
MAETPERCPLCKRKLSDAPDMNTRHVICSTKSCSLHAIPLKKIKINRLNEQILKIREKAKIEARREALDSQVSKDPSNITLDWEQCEILSRYYHFPISAFLLPKAVMKEKLTRTQ